MFTVTVGEIINLGIGRETVSRNLLNGNWKYVGSRPGRSPGDDCEISLSSLPSDIQIKWLQHSAQKNLTQEAIRPRQVEDSHDAPNDEEFERVLARFPFAEREAWVEEVCRLARLVERYRSTKPKREYDHYTKKHVYVRAVLELCDEAVCTHQVILSHEPHRADPPSPHTLHRWSGNYRKEGILTFFRQLPGAGVDAADRRRAPISVDAARWVNSNWRSFKGARPLFKAIEKEAKSKGWTIPSESWFYRAWDQIPNIVATYLFEGEAAYVSKHSPHVPRDFSDLEALQILCGDHSERDVFVMWKDKTLIRPWLTPWQDLRTGLIWGHYLGLSPSSQAAALAYVDGVRTFGAQPLSRPDQGLHSYLYTDWGRTYVAHRWDGKVISVHEKVMESSGGMSLLLKQREIGILNDLQLKHLLARRWNAKEKPIERTFKVISEWESNTFDSYCGPNPSKRPERLKILFAQHQQYLEGRREASPFPTFEEYREKLSEFITRYNHSEHERTTLGGERLVPIEEYRRLYTTRYEISPKTLALLLLQPGKRTIKKNGINCFRKDWNYSHESMSQFKGSKVEILFSDDDYSSVWVILPNKEICEAHLITPTSILNPNKETLEDIKRTKAKELQLIKNYHLLNESQLRGEKTDDRVMHHLERSSSEAAHPTPPLARTSSAKVYQLTRFDHSKKTPKASTEKIATAKILEGEVDDSMFASSKAFRIREFHHE